MIFQDLHNGSISQNSQDKLYQDGPFFLHKWGSIDICMCDRQGPLKFLTCTHPANKISICSLLHISIISCNSEYSQIYTKVPIINIHYRRKDNTINEFKKRLFNIQISSTQMNKSDRLQKRMHLWTFSKGDIIYLNEHSVKAPIMYIHEYSLKDI